ncbi:MAG: Glycine hydroxymethyltransferase [Thermoleophilia bacterium]|jgi:glycine hydroxymethyltransferase|nr:Glycine hydroxymethyltransferase [Thermoleophilia bacterium]
MATTASSDLLARTLRESDSALADLLRSELHRQRDQIELIASENFVSRAVLEAAGSVATNKYAEGYPGRRYYGGCEVVDQVEQLAIDRAKELFGAEHANVQPHAGSQANFAAYMALVEPGDTILAMSLDHGGHLTHGHSVNFSGKLFNFVHYGVERDSHLIDFDAVLRLAKEHRPKLIVAGGSAYPRQIDAARFRAIADEVGALLMVDMAHFAGLVAAGVHPDVVEHCDVVTSTTHKTLRGPRSGLILSKERHAKAIDRAVFPGMQGGPLCHIVAAKAVCFAQAMTDGYRAYARQTVVNTKAMGRELEAGGWNLVSGGTDTHLVLADLRGVEWTGRDAEDRLAEVNVTVNRNSVPFDTQKPMITSGVRAGMAAMTTRGFTEEAARETGRIMVESLRAEGDEVEQLAQRASALLQDYPLYPELEEGYA